MAPHIEVGRYRNTILVIKAIEHLAVRSRRRGWKSNGKGTPRPQQAMDGGEIRRHLSHVRAGPVQQRHVNDDVLGTVDETHPVATQVPSPIGRLRSGQEVSIEFLPKADRA